MQVLGRDFQVSAASFFQVNAVMAAKMVEHVLANLPIPPSTILDVYCGVGLFSAFLAPKCKRLIGIESSEPACEDFAVNLEEFDNVELYEDVAENVLPALDVQPEIILVDPPRAGLQAEALDAIVKMKPGTVIYVSCDPSTLARDAARLLKGGYHLSSVTPFDLFPQTYHIESISWFER
jgi:23S rRNA (uracil1939-C5)-methyltransferase